MNERRTLRGLGPIAIVTLLTFPVGSPARADSEPFFKGKTIKLIQARRPGGAGDMRVRSIMKFLSDHIPGHPGILSQYMPGGGGRLAANHLYRAARPDGLTIANIGGGFLMNAVLGQPGANYDVRKVAYLGSGNSKGSYAFFTRKDLGLDTLDKLRAAPRVRVGGQNIGHDVYTQARLFVWILDLRNARFVVGYSGPEMDVAFIRGELDARSNNNATMLRRNPEWISDKLIDLHAVMEVPKGHRISHPAFKGVPALDQFSKTKAQRKALELRRNIRLVGSPYLLPPGVPADRVKILKEAFDKTLKDPRLTKEWEKLTGEPPAPVLADEQTTAVRSLSKDPEVITVFKQIAGAGPIPWP